MISKGLILNTINDQRSLLYILYYTNTFHFTIIKYNELMNRKNIHF